MTGPRPAERRWTSFEERQLSEMLEAGMKPLEIASKLKRTLTAVYSRPHRLRKGTKAPKPGFAVAMTAWLAWTAIWLIERLV